MPHLAPTNSACSLHWLDFTCDLSMLSTYNFPNLSNDTHIVGVVGFDSQLDADHW